MNTDLSFLSAKGEMGELTRNYDWGSTSLGTPDTWPQSLRTTLSILLNSKFPMFLFWGDEHICLYNDAYRPSLGINGKHPWALGKNGEEVWPEIWPVIKPLMDEVLTGQGSVWRENQLIPIYRNGQLEDVYWTFSYSPVYDEANHIAGVFVACTETTDVVNAMRDLEDSREELQQAIDNAELATWDFDPASEKFTSNERLKEWFGLPQEESIDLRKALDSISDKDRDRVAEAIGNALRYEQGGKLDVEYTLIHPSTGRERIVRGKGAAQFDEHKIANRLNGTVQDITEQAMSAKTERNFRNMVEQAPVGITIFSGPEFIVEAANDTYLQIIDRKKESFIGKSLFEGLPEVKDAVEPLLKQVYETGVPYFGKEFPVTLNRHGKVEHTFFDFVYQPLRDEHNDTTGIIVVATEVTDYVKTKRALAENEKEFRNLVMQSPIAMTIFRGRDYVVEMANSIMYEKLWRRKEADVLGKPILEVFPELKEQKYAELLDRVYDTGITHRESESPALVMGDDGMKKFYLDFEYAALFDADNKVWGLMVTVIDVTDRVNARKVIEEAEAKARLAVEAAELGVYEVDIETDVVTADERFNNIFGVPHTVSRKEYEKMYHPDDLAFRKEKLLQLMKDGDMDYEIRLLVNGAVRWIRTHGQVLYNEHGKAVKLAGIIQDITHVKESVKELESKVNERIADMQKLNMLLNRSNEDLLQFAHVASHDLKEPVRKIRLFSSMLRDEIKDSLSERSNFLLEKIMHATTRINTMIEGVLKYSSIDSANEADVPVDLHKIIQDIIVDLEVPVREKLATIKYSALPTVYGLKDLLYQLFYNLINNALKFAKPSGNITIDIEHSMVEQGGIKYLQVTVKDNGIGFDNAFSQKIFATFARLNSKDQYEGTGLGLTLCKKIVDRHEGYIYADGKPGEGAVFTVLLPM